jgi:hypothetical protein
MQLEERDELTMVKCLATNFGERVFVTTVKDDMSGLNGSTISVNCKDFK